MTPIVIGALLAVASLIWVIAPIFEDSVSETRRRDVTAGDDEAAEAEIRKWRNTKT